MKRIAVAGLGYVGASNALMLSQHYIVTALDILPEKVDMINHRISPVSDRDMAVFLTERNLHLKATTNVNEAFEEADIIIIAAPTDYDTEQGHLNTDIVESLVEQAVKCSPDAMIVIRSTVTATFTQKISEKLDTDNIFFCPEFLREGQALHDSLYPTRIVLGAAQWSDKNKKRADEYINIMKQCMMKKEVTVSYMHSTEAETVKLFANTYLALRIAFFNEMDTFAEYHNIRTEKIIEGVCEDERIGNYYNNPSFGYGGYCLPKDSKQLSEHYKDVPEKLISAVVNSNQTRMDHISQMIIKRNPQMVGIYKLAMKRNSDNFRQSSTLEIVRRLKEQSVPMVLFEPLLEESEEYNGITVIKDLQVFKRTADVIVANRWDKELEDVKEKVYTRDIFGRD